VDHVVADRRGLAPNRPVNALNALEDDSDRRRTADDVDCLGRSLTHLTGLVNELCARRCSFRSLTEAIDTSAVDGKLGQRSRLARFSTLAS
jgi:DNA invertase Pin-like site-specific DNA recombinase